MSDLRHIMVDIETAGNGTDTAMFSISAVQFDIKTGETGFQFDAPIDLQSCLDAGFKATASTILWWMGQSDEARKKLIAGQKDAKDLLFVLQEFKGFIILCAGAAGVKPEEIEMWGNSAKFDLSPIENGYKKFDIPLPWNPWKERCYRTMDSYRPHIRKNMPFVGVKHYGPDDCKHQIKALVQIHRDMNPTYDQRMLVSLAPKPHETETD